MKINKLMQLLKDNARAEAGEKASIRMEKAEDGVHIYIYDVIDSYWGANAKDLIKAIADADGKEIHLHINSPGGDVFEARAMSAALVGYGGNVTTHIDGICASAATYLALCGNEIRMTDGGLFMIHNSWTFAMGSRMELRQTADLLEKIDGMIAADYIKKTGETEAQVKAWMDAETWFTAQEALDSKFIDVIAANTKSGKSNSAQWNLSAYANAPKVEKEEPKENEQEIEAQIAAQFQRNQNRLRMLAQGI